MQPRLIEKEHNQNCQNKNKRLMWLSGNLKHAHTDGSTYHQETTKYKASFQPQNMNARQPMLFLSRFNVSFTSLLLPKIRQANI